MPRDRRRGIGLSLALILAVLPGCRSHKDDAKAQADAAEGRNPNGSSPRSVDDRVPRFTGAAVGMQPGYIEGAMVYASARAETLQTVVQALPMRSHDARDLAELGRRIGADPRVDDLLAQFGVDRNARISVSLRPVLDHAAQVRRTLEQASATVDELVGRDRDAINSGTPLSDAAQVFTQQSASLGVHVRVHVPIAAPAKVDVLLDRLRAELAWTKTCAALGPAKLCGGDSSSLLVVRAAPGAVVVDLLLTHGGGPSSDDPVRRALAQQAVALATAASLPRVEALRGDATVLIDGPTAVSFARAELLAHAISRLRESESKHRELERFRERDQALRKLHETDRLFEGISVELSIRDDRLLATGKWLATATGKPRLPTVFELTPVDADVPSIAGLCSGATICGRSRGLWARERFARLATGVYADPKALAELLDDHEEHSMLVLLLETWPNAIGSTTRLPGPLFDAPESMAVQTALDVSGRTLGFGFSLTDDWVAYARMTSADLSTVRGLLQLAGSRLSSVAIPGVEGRIESTPIPDRRVPGSFYSITETATASGEWGWAVLADTDDRVAWLAGLAHDDGAVPLAYVEIPDLWRILATDRGTRGQLEFAQAWLSDRWVRAQLTLGEDRAPELQLASGKL